MKLLCLARELSGASFVTSRSQTLWSSFLLPPPRLTFSEKLSCLVRPPAKMDPGFLPLLKERFRGISSFFSPWSLTWPPPLPLPRSFHPRGVSPLYLHASF